MLLQQLRMAWQGFRDQNEIGKAPIHQEHSLP